MLTAALRPHEVTNSLGQSIPAAFFVMALPLVLVASNNSIVGYELHAEHVHYGMHADACRFGPVDHAAIARATGGFWERVSDPDGGKDPAGDYPEVGLS